jgi:hypothetical protein
MDEPVNVILGDSFRNPLGTLHVHVFQIEVPRPVSPRRSSYHRHILGGVVAAN